MRHPQPETAKFALTLLIDADLRVRRHLILCALNLSCAGCSYVSHPNGRAPSAESNRSASMQISTCCCSPRNEKPITSTKFPTYKTKTVTTTVTAGKTKRDVQQQADDDRMDSRNLCPPCPGRSAGGPQKAVPGLVKPGDSFCCPPRRVVVVTRTKGVGTTTLTITRTQSLVQVGISIASLPIDSG